MAHSFRYGEVFEFSGVSGNICGLQVRQDMSGRITFRNSSPDRLVAFVKSGERVLFGTLDPDQWSRFDLMHGDYHIVVSLMESKTEAQKIIASMTTDMGILPESVEIGLDHDFEVKIAA